MSDISNGQRDLEDNNSMDSISELWHKNIIQKFLIGNFQINFFKIHLSIVVRWAFSRSSNAESAKAFEMLNTWTSCPFRAAARLPAQWPWLASNLTIRCWPDANMWNHVYRFLKKYVSEIFIKLHNCIFIDSFHSLLILIGIFYTNILLFSAILIITSC